MMLGCCVQPSLDTEVLIGAAAEVSDQQQQPDETSRLSGACSADDHALDNCTFSSLQRCHVCDKYLWGIVRQGYHCRGEPMLASFC